MAKYMVGDRVVVREDLKDGVRYGMDDLSSDWVAVDGMLEIRGKVVTIKEVRRDCYCLEEFCCKWTDEMFAGLESEVLAAQAPVDDLL